MNVRRRPQPAFSLIELVIVVVIIGIIAAIAIPRFGSAADRSRDAALRADLRVVTTAIEYYAAEHADMTPAHEKDGSVITDQSLFVRRLMLLTDADGALGAGGPLGPYLRVFPENPYNRRLTVRIDGAPAGANTHGWRFDTAAREFLADDSPGSASIRPGGVANGAAAAVGAGN